MVSVQQNTSIDALLNQCVAAVSCIADAPRLTAMRLRIWLTGMLGRAWVGAWVSAW